MIPFVILKPICFNRPLAVLVRDAENTEGDLFFLIGRRRSGKNLSPSGNFCPTGAIDFHLPPSPGK